MGAAFTARVNQCCTAPNQAVDSKALNNNRATSRARGTLYAASSDDESDHYNHGEASFSDSDSEPEPTDHLDDESRKEVFETFTLAIDQGNTSLLTYYFQEYPNVNWGLIRWKNGDSCVHRAVRMKNYQLIELLLREGPHNQLDINDPNPNTGDTPLHVAVEVSDRGEDGDEDIVKLFTANEHFDVEITNHKMLNPIALAEELHKYEILDLLSKYAPDLDVGTYSDLHSDSEDADLAGGGHNANFRDRSESLDPDEVPLIGGDIETPEYRAVEDADDILVTNRRAKLVKESEDMHHIQMSTGFDMSMDGNTPSDETPQPDLLSYGAMAPPVLSPSPLSALSIEEMTIEPIDGRPIEYRMAENDKQTLKRLKLKNKNPFSKVRVTQQESMSLTQNLRDLEQLPDLEGFLSKQTSKAPHTWHKRWVLVTDDWLLWNDRIINVNIDPERGPTLEERKRFKGAVNMRNIVEVVRTGNSGRKFMVKVAYKTHEKLHERSVMWKCLNRQEREDWVMGLHKYLHYRDELKRLYND